MGKRVLFISIVILAVSSASFGLRQTSYFIGGDAGAVGRSGDLSRSADTTPSTCVDQQSKACYGGLCGTSAIQRSGSSLGQGAVAWGCGGSSGAVYGTIGGGIQYQTSRSQPAPNKTASDQMPQNPSCSPVTKQKQAMGAIGGQCMAQTCGVGGAAVYQGGSISQAQNLNNPSSGGSQYQHMSGMQSGAVQGNPTSYSSAGSLSAGGGIQCQQFGGLANSQ